VLCRAYEREEEHSRAEHIKEKRWRKRSQADFSKAYERRDGGEKRCRVGHMRGKRSTAMQGISEGKGGGKASE
jgi:hypothetical protein